jgi:hypothetical protein
MLDVEVEFGTTAEITAEMVRAQLELLVRDEAFRSSKRSIAFLRYVVEETLAGQADQIKERSIGIEVFGRDPAYDTNVDHVVRTAAAELRKRLATYYVDKKHDSELRMALVPGSYVPRFTRPDLAPVPIPTAVSGRTAPAEADAAGEEADGFHGKHNGCGHAGQNGAGLDSLQVNSPAHAVEAAPARRRRRLWISVAAAALVAAIAAGAGYRLLRGNDAEAQFEDQFEDQFWKPVINTPGPILVAVGDHPNGPPTQPETETDETLPTPIPSTDASETVPFADTVTIARVVGVLAARNKQVVIRRESASSFSDLRQGAAVLIGAFNNEWSLRLTRQLRFSLAMDADKHLIYIRDAKNPAARNWSWGTNQPTQPVTGANSPRVQDYALISRIRDSETGHVVVVVGGLYTYGTQAAGEFLTDPSLMREVDRQAEGNPAARNLQIVLGTTVTDGTPGPPRVLAVSTE